MRPLATEFTHGGYQYRQVERIGNLAIFEQSSGGRTLSYELVRVQTRPAETIRGKEYPARELYPSSEMWGEEAWTIANLETATERLHRMAKFKPLSRQGTGLEPCRGLGQRTSPSLRTAGLEVAQ